MTQYGMIDDHCFEKPTDGKDECAYEQCRFPEGAHLWSQNATEANPPLASA